MTCSQTAHILDLYDNFCEAEIAYARFLDWEIDLADKVSKRKCAKYTEAEDEKHKLEYEIIMLAKEAARVAMMEIGSPQSGVAALTMVAVNLTMFIWDLVERGEIDWDPENENAIVDIPLHHNLILKAWHASLWLAGLTDDPRFSLETITSDLAPTPLDEA